MSDMYALTLTPASKYCGVSTSIVQKFRREGLFPNAFKDDSGHWRIPTQDLDSNAEAMKADPNEQRKGRQSLAANRLANAAEYMGITDDHGGGKVCSEASGMTCQTHKADRRRGAGPSTKELRIELKDGSRVGVVATNAKIRDGWLRATDADGSTVALVASEQIKYVLVVK